MKTTNTNQLTQKDILRSVRATRFLGGAILLFVVAAVFFSARTVSASAANVYIAQASAGAASGADCADALPVSWFSNAANWNGGASQIGPGTTVHLCGTITSALTPLASGTSGSPITLLFESGASMSQPYCPSNGCLNLSGLSYITVNGNNVGTIQSTANGTSPGYANQQPSTGIVATPCNNCTIENLTISNIYVHTSVSDDSIDQTQMRCIEINGSNWLITGNVLHDAGWCVEDAFGNGDTNDTVSNNNIYNVDHGVAPEGYGSVSASHIYVHGNHIHDFANWDTTSDSYHHDGVHGYGTSGANVTDLEVYDNQFDGNPGNEFNADIYLERPDNSGSVTNGLVFNNTIDCSQSMSSNFGCISIGALSGAQVYNNTILGGNANATYCMLLNAGNTIVKNNIMSGCWAFIVEYQPIPNVTLSNNTYAAIGSCGWSDGNGTCQSTIASWQSFSGTDANSQLVSSANLSTAFIPNPGSPVITAGANLTIVGVTPLDSDKSGAARPTSGTWSAGAYNSGVTASQPAPPTGLLATAQ